jgi:hypothetical protein
MKNFFKFIFWTFIIIGGIYWISVSHSASSSSEPSNISSSYSDTYENADEYTDNETPTITYDEALSEYWDDIKSYANGTEEIEACYYGNGNCYSLEADISDGDIETLYFDNGGYISVIGGLDSSGEADAMDDEGNDWTFTLDMTSTTIEYAVDEWASDNGYEIE